MSNSSLWASELMVSVGPARAQELLDVWPLVGKQLRHQLAQQSIDRTPTTRDTPQPDLGPGVDLVRDPTNEDCFRVKADGTDQVEIALHDDPVDVTDEPTPPDEVIRNATAAQPDFTADSEGPRHGIPNFLRSYKDG